MVAFKAGFDRHLTPPNRVRIGSGLMTQVGGREGSGGGNQFHDKGERFVGDGKGEAGGAGVRFE